MEKIKTTEEIRGRIVRQINNNLLQIILEYVGFELSVKTIFKINSNFKNFVELIYQNQMDHLSEFKKELSKFFDFLGTTDTGKKVYKFSNTLYGWIWNNEGSSVDIILMRKKPNV